MCVEVFTKLLPKCDVSPASLKWFPVWVGRYARFPSVTALLGTVKSRSRLVAGMFQNKAVWKCHRASAMSSAGSCTA